MLLSLCFDSRVFHVKHHLSKNGLSVADPVEANPLFHVKHGHVGVSPKKPHCPGFPFLPGFQYQAFNFEPVIGARAGQFAVGGVAKDNGFTALLPQADYVFRGIININMGADRAFVVHKADVPVGDVVVVQPFYSLGD